MITMLEQEQRTSTEVNNARSVGFFWMYGDKNALATRLLPFNWSHELSFEAAISEIEGLDRPIIVSVSDRRETFSSSGDTIEFIKRNDPKCLEFKTEQIEDQLKKARDAKAEAEKQLESLGLESAATPLESQHHQPR